MKLTYHHLLHRLRSPQTLVLLAALGLGAAAAVLSHSAQNQERSLLKEALIQAEALTEVVVAGRSLPRNTVVREEDLAVRLLPQNWLHAEHVVPDAVDQLIGVRLKRDIPSGSPLSVGDTESRDPLRRAITVRPGYRLLSLPADETSSVSGLIRPGHWIDLWTSSVLPPEANALQSDADIRVVHASAQTPLPADLVASAVRVVAVGGDTRAIEASDENGGAGRYSSLTIEVPGNLVAPLLAAQARGRLIALLRPEAGPTAPVKRPSARPSGALSATSGQSNRQVEVIVHSQGGQS